MSGADDFFRRIKAEAHAEIIRVFGQAWRGGKFDAGYLGGHVPVPSRVLSPALQNGDVSVYMPGSNDATTHGDYGIASVTFPTAYPGTTLRTFVNGGGTTLSVVSAVGFAPGQRIHLRSVGQPTATSERAQVASVNLATNVITLSAPLTYGYFVGHLVTCLPTVVLTSHDIGWVPYLSDTDASGALTAGGVANVGFNVGLSRRVSLNNTERGSQAVTIIVGASFGYVDVTFPTPYEAAPYVGADTPNSDYTVFATTPTTAGFRLYMVHTPQTVNGVVGAMQPITPATSVKAQATTDTGTPGSTGNQSSAATGNSSISNTSNQDRDHSHNVPSAPPVQTGGTSVGHLHTMDHSHPHDHTHPAGAHTHQVDDHHHAFSSSATPITGSDVTLTVGWLAYGQRTAPAVTKLVDWLARA